MSTVTSIGLWLEKWDRFGPERVALVSPAPSGFVRWTYRDLFRRAQRRAAWLRDVHGVRPGDRVAWREGNRPEFFETLFACARLGAILVPINWRLAQPEIDWIVGHCAPRVVLEAANLAPLDDWSDPAVPCAEATADTPLMILYTSGTTGRPKGAVLTHGSITWNSVNTQLACDLRADDSTVTFTPLFHTGAVNVLSLPLLHRGGKVVLLPRFDGPEILRAIERERVTILFGVPTTFEMLRDDPGFARADLASVRFALCGGAPTPVGLIHQWAARGVVFRQGFGLTEVGPNCFSLPPEDAVRKAGTVGFPVMHCEARVVDAAGRDVPPGQTGELWLRGPHVCAGYWNDPTATAAALHEGGWWATGDLFQVDPDGYFKVVGRKKEMFISGGENVYPAEVEAAILQFPGVRECAVVGVADPRWGEVGRAYVAPADVAPEALLDFLRQRIGRYKVPKAVVTLDALPRNALGKVLKHQLAELVSV
ncbi:MAG: long-chain fatty acid--CoA ligase [Planctomycetes bacterium]|nr:long-chain fatty acid--CoA ligase [Planctomycetota bacterium]